VILKYVLRNFSRRKVRTILMILALMVSTGLIVTMSATVETVRQSNVDLIASAVGRYDLSVTKRDTSPDPFIDVEETRESILEASSLVTAVYPRIESGVELNIDGEMRDGTLIALDPQRDDIGFIDVVDGDYQLGNGKAALLEATANNYDLHVGDVVDVSYSYPLPREQGQPVVAGASERRTVERFEITAVVRQDGVTSGGVREGLMVHLADAQAWLGLPGQAQKLVATLEPALYETNNADVAALRVRDVVSTIQARLGNDYQFAIEKARALSDAAQAFLLVQALITIYGLMALGIVGLLVHTLVMTNVQEQRRDMAVIRIVGGQRNYLFRLVIVEVLVIGAIGVSLGVGLGDLITRFAVVPLIEQQMAAQGISSPLIPRLTVAAVLPVIGSALFVLILSSLKPAQEAARTKVMHAINPSVADNIQIADLTRLRERRPDTRLFLGGLALMLIFVLIAGFQAMENFGGPALQVTFILLALGLLVLGLGLMFFITTVPFERLVLFAMSLLMPRLSYFARRNVGRGQTRNTLISLLVLFSGVLPSFLATQSAMERANFEATVRHQIGAPADIQVPGYWSTQGDAEQYRLRLDFRTRDLAGVTGVAETVGLTYGYPANVSDPVGFRQARLTVYGVDGSLNDVLFTELIQLAYGRPEALDALAEDPAAIVISEGLAEHLAVSLGDVVKVNGEGTDHVVDARIIAIARSIPSINGIGRSRIAAQSGSDALMSLAGFRQLITPLNQPLPPADKRIIGRVMFSLAPGEPAEEVLDEIGKRFGQDYPIWTRSLEVQLESAERSQAAQRILLLVLTSISFTTAVFGVFAVIYVTIYARRLEIGMMKAMGMKRRELTGMLIIESIAMTLGAALAGITAGATMGYVAFYGERILAQRPVTFAVDSTVIPFIAIMVVLASVLGAVFSSRRIIKKRAVDILRMQ
jgi:putative ABC transport system permease protein